MKREMRSKGYRFSFGLSGVWLMVVKVLVIILYLFIIIIIITFLLVVVVVCRQSWLAPFAVCIR